jgi:hypothetical protein
MLANWLATLADWLAILGNWLAILGNWLAILGNWLAILGNWLAMLGHWLAMLADWRTDARVLSRKSRGTIRRSARPWLRCASSETSLEVASSARLARNADPDGSCCGTFDSGR